MNCFRAFRPACNLGNAEAETEGYANAAAPSPGSIRCDMALILKSQLDAENLAVAAELDALDFYDDLEDVDVYLVSFGSAYGWQYYGSSGDIHIPCVSAVRLGDLLFGRACTSLRDVLRHEYAHAVADLHRGLIRSRRFTEAFGFFATLGG